MLDCEFYYNQLNRREVNSICLHLSCPSIRSLTGGFRIVAFVRTKVRPGVKDHPKRVKHENQAEY